MWLEGKFMTFAREGNFTSSHFFASKDVMGKLTWAATNGGATNGGLRCVYRPLLEIGLFRPFFLHFSPFSGSPDPP